MYTRKDITKQPPIEKILLLLTILLLSTVNNICAQNEDVVHHKKAYPGGKCYMMRLMLRDKCGTPCSLDKPEAFLSGKAIARRHRQHLDVDSTDLPVSRLYIDQLRQQNLEIVCLSKWNNSVVVRDKSMQKLKSLKKLDFVTNCQIVWRSPDSINVNGSRMDYRKEIKKWDDVEPTVHGAAHDQTCLLGGDILANRGYRGRGMTIAVLDGGFMNVDKIESFKNIRIAGIKDMVYPFSHNIYKSVDHGTKVLSTMAVSVPGIYTGTAPEADYWLIDCEDGESEQLVEEDYWTAAAEFADSVGVDIITSSLGYHEFDYKDMNHRYRDLDGHTTAISNAASLLASKGIVMVCSAGNDGMGSWKKINAPADACDIITVGAVSLQHQNAAFSSVGPTADGRVKPDVMACGSPAAVITGRGTILRDIGTSFAAPQVAGLVACLWQRYPTLSALDIIKAVRASADNADSPDNIMGYGIPDFSHTPLPH